MKSAIVSVLIFVSLFLVFNIIHAESEDNAEFYNSQGITEGKQGRSEQAISSFNKAIELNPNYADAYCSRGIVYFDLKMF